MIFVRASIALARRKKAVAVTPSASERLMMLTESISLSAVMLRRLAGCGPGAGNTVVSFTTVESHK